VRREKGNGKSAQAGIKIRGLYIVGGLKEVFDKNIGLPFKLVKKLLFPVRKIFKDLKPDAASGEVVFFFLF